MTLSCEEQLRRDLLLKALEVFRDTEAAMAATLRMERFVRSGELSSVVPFHSPTSAGASQSALRPPVSGANSGTIEDGDVAKRRRWSEADDALLRRFWSEGLTARAISERLQRSEASVATRASVLKLKRASDKPLIRSPQETRGLDRTRVAAAPAASAHRTAETAPARCAAPGKRPAEGPARSSNGTATEGPIESVIRFLRSRDYSVVRTDEGRFRLDEREDLTPQELLSRANKVRAFLHQPPFPAMAS